MTASLPVVLLLPTIAVRIASRALARTSMGSAPKRPSGIEEDARS